MNTIIVDDDFLALEQLEMECSKVDHIRLVGKFSDAHSACDYARANHVDFALVDVEMPSMNGLELGERLKGMNPSMILVYVTGHSRYVVETLKRYADYCITKPYTHKDIEEVVGRAKLLGKRLYMLPRIRTFGTFDLYIEDTAVRFPNTKTKELFAFCVDKLGEPVSPKLICAKLWPEKTFDEATKRMIRKTISMLVETLDAYGIGYILVSNRGNCYVDPEQVDCDFFKLVFGEYRNKLALQRLFNEGYMIEYPWAQSTFVKIAKVWDK